MKSAALIMLALFIDGIQAAVSASLALIAAFPGTVGGAAAGCAAASATLGSWACGIGGLIFGLLGTTLDAAAVVTEPVGLMLGFAISICLSVTLGAGLIMLLILCNMFYPKYLLPGGVAELMPGFDLIPGWTAMTIMCVLQKVKDEKRGGTVGAVAAVVTTSPSPASLVQAARAVDGIRGPAPQTNAA